MAKNHLLVRFALLNNSLKENNDNTNQIAIIGDDKALPNGNIKAIKTGIV